MSSYIYYGMDTVEMPKSEFDNIIQENSQLKKENELLRSGKLAKLYKNLDEHYKEIAQGKIFTRKDLKI